MSLGNCLLLRPIERSYKLDKKYIRYAMLSIKTDKETFIFYPKWRTTIFSGHQNYQSLEAQVKTAFIQDRKTSNSFT